MVNIYNSMLTTHALTQELVQLGFVPQPQPDRFQAGPIQVQVLDAPRLCIVAPSGLHYIAVLTLGQLTQFLASL